MAGAYGPDRVTSYVYDNSDHVLEERRAVDTDLEQIYAKYVYNGGVKESVTDANGNYTYFQYDNFDRLKKTFYPSKTTAGAYNSLDYEQLGYDRNGNRNYWRKRSGVEFDFTMDRLNREIVKHSRNPNTQDVHYDYDLQGLTLQSKFASLNGEGAINEFNGFGELIRATNTMKASLRTLTYQYDLNGNRTRITHPEGGNAYFEYLYNALDQVYGINERTNAIISFAYDEYSRPTTIERGTLKNGASTHFEFDGINRLTALKQNLSGESADLINGFTYTPSSQIQSISYSNTQYQYLEGAQRFGTYEVNGLNQYTHVDGTVMDYDANSNLTKDGDTNYVYDDENRLIAVTGGLSASLVYDPLGRLFEVTIAGVKRQFLYDGDALVAEYTSSGSNTPENRYVHGDGADVPLVQYNGASISTSSRRFLHVNHQGSIIAHTGDGGNVTVTNAYDPYGIPEVGNQGRFGYTGQVWLPELGLYHYKARMYEPRLGRFLQTDPVGYEDQMNLYAYVHNDPLNYTDPTGEFGLLGAAVGGGIGFIASVATQKFTGDGKINWGTVAAATIAGAAVGATGGLAAGAVAKIGLTGIEAGAAVAVPSAGVAYVGGATTQIVENLSNEAPMEGVHQAGAISAAGTVVGGVLGGAETAALTNSNTMGTAGTLVGGKVAAEIITTVTQEAVTQTTSAVTSAVTSCSDNKTCN